MTQVISISADELHISLNVPRHAAKSIFRWAREQQWPEGTSLEDFNEYHCTLLYSPSGYQYWSDAWFIPKLEKVEANVVAFENFGPTEDGSYAYVLRLQGDQLEIEGQKVQTEASHVGVFDNHFGAYKPHITLGYGYQKVDPATIDVPDMMIDLGPVEVSPPRLDPNATPSLEGIAKDLHDQYQDGTTPTEIVAFAKSRMASVGLPSDDLAVQAALQSWQMLYTEDKILEQHVAEWSWDSGFEKLIDEYAPYGLTCLYDETPDAIDISHLEVDPRVRSNGLGTQFMNAAHQYARSVGKNLVVSRVDNVPFFSKFPFLNQESDKRFVTAMWESDSNWYSGSPIAAKHSRMLSVPGDEKYMNQELQPNQLEPNPHAGVHQSWISNGPQKLYVKPETGHDFHGDSPIKERAAFVLGNAMGMKVPHTTVRQVTYPAYTDKTGREFPGGQNFASVHHGVENTTTLAHQMAQLGINTEYKDPDYDEYLRENEAKRRQLLLLDQVIGNQDRHSGNLLVDHNGEWYPIDHGGAFGNIGAHGTDWYFRHTDFEGQPLTPDERYQVLQARNAIDHPANQELFSRSELYPGKLNERVNNLLNTGQFQNFAWT